MSEIPRIPKAKESTDLLIKKNVPFVVFRRPGRGQVELFARLKKQEPIEGALFVLAPFSARNLPDVEALQPTHHVSTSRDWRQFYPKAREEPQHKAFEHEPQASTSREEYSRAFKECQRAMAGEDGLEKVVLSRVQETTRPKGSPYTLFQSLGDKHPRAFVYLLHHPLYGIWLGATPELLLQAGYGDLRAMALAGTLPADMSHFSAKEENEHKIVADYIERVLSETGLSDIEHTSPRGIKAGEVSHLRTDFHAPYPDRSPDLMDVAIALHPTPATCGMGKDKAAALIQWVEAHDRRLYSGFVGVLDNSHCGELYVNLRCAQLFSDRINLFVGGGLTPASVEEDEWNETAMKSRTLLSVFENI